MDKGENSVKKIRKIIFICLLCVPCLAGCGRSEKQTEDRGELVLVSAQRCVERCKSRGDVPGFFLDRKHPDWYNILRVTGKN